MDNKSSIDIAYNPTEHNQRSKHIDRRHFFVRECLEVHDKAAPYECSLDNMADFFTIALPPRVFVAMRDNIMNVAHWCSCPGYWHGGVLNIVRHMGFDSFRGSPHPRLIGIPCVNPVLLT
eukprot:674215-Pleurochrysis_carterae.AAC.1